MTKRLVTVDWERSFLIYGVDNIFLRGPEEDSVRIIDNKVECIRSLSDYEAITQPTTSGVCFEQVEE
jgi:hypothetical protein